MGKITFSSDVGGFRREDTMVTEEMVKKYFKTDENPEQMPPTKETQDFLYKSCQGYMNVLKDDDKVVGFMLLLPARKELMNDFISKKINEVTLFERIMRSPMDKIPQTIYLCSTIVLEDYRGKGFAVEGTLKILDKFKKNKPILFSWSISPEGDNMAKKISKISGLKLIVRKD